MTKFYNLYESGETDIANSRDEAIEMAVEKVYQYQERYLRTIEDQNFLNVEMIDLETDIINAFEQSEYQREYERELSCAGFQNNLT